ncbi:IgaA/UmoB family intracellular growth attenuator [Pseudomonas protegens]|uniref:IgaA/UmoB family intracellular growth attenuator n=1 Tax=Pseudomonas protegens TaxID=380021 RepID=UPI00069FE378|nr:IgaA/UmoB family intracellular growth attenuator [Pseudomonas protegens]MDX9684006.1 IgaA/UmoB family intracellular growth attenuator [Pseudomonas protegens]URN89067.1 MAG: intracellular growth attenuator family protein [Pseudomonas protegens]WEK27158.1 MAG: IgaA/UmoB family intracellular growth attenuator [Pseudomonas protegens]
MNLFFTLATLALAVFSLVSVVIYLSRRAKYRMNLQDLHLHGKAHRSITQAELDELAKQTASLQRIQGSGGMSYKPISDSVYLISGGTASDGLELQVQSVKHMSIAGIPVELPFPMESFLADNNQAEVVIAKKFAVVIGLNGHRLAQ